MSDAQDAHDEHESPIKTPKQLITVVVLAFVVPILIIVLLVMYVTSGKQPGAGSDALSEAAIEARIQPVAGFQLVDVTAPKVLAAGDAVYNAQCAACHATGAAGAPKLGDNAAWAPRIQAGYEALLNSSLKGKGAMPPQGGGQFSDLEIGRAVVYMVNQSGGDMAEPQAPAADEAKVEAPAAGTQAAAAPAASAPAPAASAPAAQAPAQTAAAAPAAVDGAKVYNQFCVACHAAGVAGAPKLGDKAAWAPRLEQGIPGLLQSVINGKGVMPPKGGAPTASEDELRAAVVHMVDSVQ